MASPSNTISRQTSVPQGLRSNSPGGLSSSYTGSRDFLTARLASSPVQPSAIADAPTSSRAASIRSDKTGHAAPALGDSTSLAGPGASSALAAALASQLGNAPSRMGTPGARAASPAQITDLNPRASKPCGTSGLENPEIVKRHLVQAADIVADIGGDTAATSATTSVLTGKGKQLSERQGASDDGNSGAAEEFSSLQLQGGDVTRPIYKWSDRAEEQKIPRTKSFSHPRPNPESEVLDISTIKAPGGFRRNYLRRAADDAGEPEAVGPSGAERGQARQPQIITNNFIEFLTLYGHFAGEELEEDDEALGPGEYFASGEGDSDEDGDGEPTENSALLSPSARRRRKHHKKRGGSGTNSPMGAAMLLLKSFVGTGVLFLPRAYYNGGMLFSNLVLFFVAALSYYCFVLLVNTRLKVEGSFGDIGGILYGNYMRQIILASIVISQIGFVAAYIVFTSENLRAFILAVSDCKAHIDIKWLILMQMVIFMPLALLRDIGKLGFTALIADAFILLGLAYLFGYDVWTLQKFGMADIINFNKDHWTLFIGTAIFTFEGIGLIIPIQESMRDQTKFPRVMAVVMVIITTLFIGMGAFSYAAYGSKTETVVLLNLPQDNRMVNGVQLLYSLAILLSTPLQIFPAIRITENALFTRSGKYNPYIKWQKNAYRFFLVAGCAAIAWLGADSLDKFVAIVGNFACIPLVYIYPPLLHYKAVARNALWRISDIALCIFGVIAMVYTTTLTIMQWSNQSEKPPGYCDPKPNGI